MRTPHLPTTLLLCAALLAPAGARAADGCPERSRWPTKDWTAQPLPASRAQAVKAFEDYAFTLTGTDAERKGPRTDGVVIVHHGVVVYERYARGYEAGRRHLGWSMSKSAINALTAIAIDRKALALDDSICKYVKPTRQEACAITVRHLLEFSSGLDWHETYEGQSNQHSSVLAMLYGEGQKDAVGFITSHALRDAPGTSWAYSSGDTTLLAGVLDAALKPSVGKDWPWTLLLDVLGMGSAVWERDGKGVPVGSSYLYATPRDWAKLGFFFLNDGCWEDKRILPGGWVAESTTPSEALQKKPLYRDEGDVQGRQLWLNRKVPGVQDALPWPHVPEGAYALRGHWGQSVSVIPSMDLVVVRVSDDRDGTFELDTFLKLAMATVEAP
ncbi:serine hydrolase [Myxococcaceae bacterium GXIMD 01537]